MQLVNDRELMAFLPEQLFIATWYQVPNTEFLHLRNNFQVVLATDTFITVAVFIYQDIQSGYAAQIGFNAGDDLTSFSLPGALTYQTPYIDEQSNMGMPGVFVYRIDGKLLSRY